MFVVQNPQRLRASMQSTSAVQQPWGVPVSRPVQQGCNTVPGPKPADVGLKRMLGPGAPRSIEVVVEYVRDLLDVVPRVARLLHKTADPSDQDPEVPMNAEGAVSAEPDEHYRGAVGLAVA